MAFIKTYLPLVLVWLISLPLYAAPTLTLTYAGDSAKPVAGVKITQTEADGTVTVYASNSNGETTLDTTANTYTLAASLAETGTDPVDLLDAIWILQHSGELRTLTADQQKAADVNDDGEVDLLDAIYILQHSGELRTLSPNLVFLDTATGNPLSETTFSPGDTPSITVIRTGDTNQDFDPSLITDHAPFMIGKTTLIIDENEVNVGTLLGSDIDGVSLIYSITAGAEKDLFTIDASTGILIFKTSPDYEDPTDTGGDNLYNVEISVSDGANTTSQAMTIAINNINEAPVFTSVTSFTVNENQTSVGTASATDEDGHTVTYSLTGTDASALSINSSSGVITFNNAPDYETKTSYSIIVNVSDGTNTATQALTINISNVNDNAPMITSSASFSAAENQTAIGTLSASDADGNTLTYTLTGNDSTSISINASSGVMAFTSAPNYEAKNSYFAIVNANDGVFTTSQTITVTITDVNDPPVMNSSASFSAAENQTAIGTLSASDEDGDALTYSTDSTSISINASSGVMTFSSAPDYETNNSYSVIVNIYDGTDTSSETITISITNVDDEIIVGTYTTFNNRMETPKLEVLNDDSFVVVWTGCGKESNGNFPDCNIYGQRFSREGMKLGDEFRVNQYPGYQHGSGTFDQSSPAISSLNTGGFVVTWEGYSNRNTYDISGKGVYARVYNTNGNDVTALSDDILVNNYTSNDQSSPAVTFTKCCNDGAVDGGFVVAWSSDGQDGDSQGIYSQRFNAQGESMAGANGIANNNQINTYTTGSQHHPVVLTRVNNTGVVREYYSGNDGDLIYAWIDATQHSPGYYGSIPFLYGQETKSSFASIFDEHRIGGYNSVNTKYEPLDATELKNGAYVITYNEDPDSGADRVGWSFCGSKSIYCSYTNTAGQQMSASTFLHMIKYYDARDNTWYGDGGFYNPRVAAINFNPQPICSSPSYPQPEGPCRRYLIVYESDAVIPAGGSISDPITGDGSGKGIFGFFIGYIDDIEFEGNQISFGWGKGFKINLITSGNQHNPDVGAFSDGGFVVSWKAETGSGANETGGVYLRLSDQITSTPGVCVNYNNFNKLHC